MNNCYKLRWLLLGLLLLLWRSPAYSEQSTSVPLTLDDRIHYQRAIEQVYWNHRIWPKENKTPKPSLDTVLPEASLRAKVTDYLQKSAALAEDWRQPITSSQLQAEMDRMARDTKQPAVLRELFAALNNDPYVIAECLARPALADRLIRNWYASDSRFHGELQQQAQSELQRFPTARLMRNLSGEYTETVWVRRQSNDAPAVPSDPSVMMIDPEEWNELTGSLRVRFVLAAGPAGAPVRSASREIPLRVVSPLKEDETGFYVTTVLEKQSGRIRIASVRWQKQPFDSWWIARKALLTADRATDAGVYTFPAILATSCPDDTWMGTSTSPPTERDYHTAVWTGTEMIIWGGYWNDGANH